MKYELWIDESGEFRDTNKKSFSIVGGILIQIDVINNIQDSDYPLKEHAHANSDSWSVKYLPDKIQEMLGHLSALKSRGKAKNSIRWVIAQNSKGEISYSSKSLYLRLLMGCVYKLYIILCKEAGIKPNDIDKAPELTVYAGSKLDVDIKENKEQLKQKDYSRYRDKIISELMANEVYHEYDNLLTTKINWEKNKQKLDANPEHENSNRKLWFADYVCNFWYNKEKWLIPDIYKKNEYLDVKECFEKVSSNCIEIPLRENDYVFEIEKKCKENDLSAAILDYCSILVTPDETMLDIEKEAIERSINKAFEGHCYRDNKKSLKTLMQQCEEIEGKTIHYDECYIKLQKISEVIENLSKNEKIDAPFDLILFKLNILCADCLLRTGQFKEAEYYTTACDKEIYNLDKKYPPEMEFQFYEKQALSYIDYFKYDAAIKNMIAAEKLFIKNGQDNLYYGEYYGDALCMHLLALMPKLRLISSDKKEIDIIEDRRYSDIALDQYVHYESELERHRQYRSFIELESSSPQSVRNALEWLIESKCGKRYNDSLHLGNTTLESELVYFFKALNANESEDTIRWYLFYYILIMAKAKSIDSFFADIMFDQLISNKKEYNILGIESISRDGITLNFYLDNDKKNKKIPPKRHPIPTIYWKLAQYLQLKYNQEIERLKAATSSSAKKNKGNKKSSSINNNTTAALLYDIRTLYSKALEYFIETIPVRKIAIESSSVAFEYAMSNKMGTVDDFITRAKEDLETLINKKSPVYEDTDLPVIMLNTLNDTSIDPIEKLNKLTYLVAY